MNGFDFASFNNLVGKGRDWGPYEELQPWQYTIYNRARDCARRCYDVNCKDYKTYGSKGVSFKFTSLYDYYCTVQSCVHVKNAWQDKKGNWHDFYSFKEFKQNPDLYDFDKDVMCQKLGLNEYSSLTLRIVLKSDNTIERNDRCGNPLSDPSCTF